jgi:hypothetical protein
MKSDDAMSMREMRPFDPAASTNGMKDKAGARPSAATGPAVAIT